MCFEFDTSLYCDDTAGLAWDRENLAADLRGLMEHFESFGLILHRGDANEKSKTVAMAFKKRSYDNPETCGGMGLSGIVIDPVKGTFVPFVKKAKVLGSIFTPEFGDSVDVIARIQAANGVFWRILRACFLLL